LQPHNSPVDYVRELFKPSKDSLHLPVCNERNFSSLGLWVFAGDVVNGVGLGHFFVEVIGPLVPIAPEKYFAQVFIGS